jgi:hypothetical protein
MKIKLLKSLTISFFTLNLLLPTISRAESEVIEGGDSAKTTFSQNASSFNTYGIGLKMNLRDINSIISTFLPYILSFAGIILLFMLISGGFTMLTAVGNPEAADKGKQQITAALLGFILLFVSYWIIQILEIILGINILGS